MLSKTREDNKVDTKGAGTIYESQKQMDSYCSMLLGQDTKQQKLLTQGDASSAESEERAFVLGVKGGEA